MNEPREIGIGNPLSIVWCLVEAVAGLVGGSICKSTVMFSFGWERALRLGLTMWGWLGARVALREDTHRKVALALGLGLFVVGLFIFNRAAFALYRGLYPGCSLVGMVLGGLSVVIWLFVLPIRAERGHPTKRALPSAVCLLIGAGLSGLLDWGWADPLLALLMVPWIFWEAKTLLDRWRSRFA